MKTRQRGITAVETVGALALGSIMLVGLTKMIDTYMEDLKGQHAAHYHAQVVAAARAYMKKEYITLKNAASASNIVVAVPLATLRNENLLPAGFSLTNNYGQQTCVLVRQAVAGSGKLDALVVTMGGERIGDKDIAAIAAKAGKGSGFISNAEPTIARGSSWSMATNAYRGRACVNGGPAVLTGTAADGGHLVSNLFYDGPGQLAMDFLHRFEVPGQTNLNKMHTSIRFDEDANATEGGNCGSHAAITFTASRELVKCDSDGRWRNITSWKKPVLNYAELSTTPGATGDVRIIRDKDLAFTYDGNTNTWVPLAMDQNGDLRVKRHIYAEGNITADDDVIARRDVRASRDVHAGNRVNGNTIHSDWWVESTHFEPTQRRWPRDPCMVPSPAGLRWTLGSMVRDDRGRIMSCQYIGGEYVFAYMDGTFTP